MTRARQAEYERLNGKYLKEARQLLDESDYAQASEKFWGATAEAIKAVAAKKGVALGSHRSLGEYTEKLHREHPDWNLPRLFNAANSLHMNFYEDWLPPGIVKDGAQAVAELVQKLKTLLD